MPTVAVLSDTHVPTRARTLPDWVESAVSDADHAIHAGDFDSMDAYDRIRELADGLTAVSGNTDPRELSLPTVADVEVGGVTFVVTHGHRVGRPQLPAVADLVRDRGGDVGVCGHTHDATDREFDGVRVLNPGSATGAGAPQPTMFVVEAADGEFEAFFRHGKR